MMSTRLAEALLAAGRDQVQRDWTTTLRLARDICRLAAASGDRTRAWDAPRARFGDLARNYVMAVAGGWAATASDLAQALQPVAESVGDDQASRVVDGRRVLLPARIARASQGMAMYAVAPAAAEALLAKLALPFAPVVTGAGTATLVLFFVDYRESDLGAYGEIGAALMGRPAADALAPPGMVVFSLPVSGSFTRDAGRAIWGYPKVLAADLAVRRQAAHVEASLTANGAPGFRIALSRRGFGASTDMPLVTYTVHEGRPTRTVMRRSGTAERLRPGGRVELELADAAGGDCACGIAAAAGSTGCLCAMLRGLGLPKAPIASGWTEVMSGSFGPPTALAATAPPPAVGPQPAPAQSSPKNSS